MPASYALAFVERGASGFARVMIGGVPETDMAIATDGVVTLKAPRDGDSRTLVEDRDDEFHRWLGSRADAPEPVACVWVSGQLVGWVDYDADQAWLRP